MIFKIMCHRPKSFRDHVVSIEDGPFLSYKLFKGVFIFGKIITKK